MDAIEAMLRLWSGWVFGCFKWKELVL